ncbi:hypothetical protein BDP27DRAFT_1371097 [Rhodocollybia butyracea]|uniref:Uncharacterized protein n=1 Tax=Rhodocollybia butyracea TaxID=206335 RepID=A0A9P5TZ20_9AGAR|nr:hypothetical protein BDP27DRAFT_1371097 [Rhodocollybia butyracea]
MAVASGNDTIASSTIWAVGKTKPTGLNANKKITHEGLPGFGITKMPQEDSPDTHIGIGSKSDNIVWLFSRLERVTIVGEDTTVSGNHSSLPDMYTVDEKRWRYRPELLPAVKDTQIQRNAIFFDPKFIARNEGKNPEETLSKQEGFQPKKRRAPSGVGMVKEKDRMHIESGTKKVER